jgi:uncharacterized protein YdhG (YjbR/CyaY superfamily)
MRSAYGRRGDRRTAHLPLGTGDWRLGINTLLPERSTMPDPIDEYITHFPPATQQALREVRETIRAAAPDATEKISYRIPTFVLNGNLVHFAGFTHHVGFYPTPSGIEHFKDELTGYTQGTGSVQFPLDEPIPHDLIGRIVEFRVQEVRSKI